MGKIYVVGERFARFIENENVISINQLEKNVFNNLPPKVDSVYVLGQGVSAERVNALLKSVEQNEDYRSKMRFPDLDKSCKNLVHKENLANSMISKPIKLTNNHYEANVYIDDQCDEMRDHITGQHIPGMAIIESCRQMFLAVTELHYLKGYKQNGYFVINKNTAEYFKFIFPLDIKIDYTVDSVEENRPGSFKFTVSMRVKQNEQICAELCYEFSTYEADFLKGKESQSALEAINMASIKI
ncbi:AfsA-related hotdog domain-containing protein [Algibacillus agarilyticus]|uniref:AfsA-related hotdog domain-containing protein n=1 Tax=Algibacillus agarilyticus TaxID=2234133 RepID=UPI000DD0384F|nr:AfsA-related hotdog domain-containing protein [Algibacillus agarilyticus]